MSTNLLALIIVVLLGFSLRIPNTAWQLTNAKHDRNHSEFSRGCPQRQPFLFGIVQKRMQSLNLAEVKEILMERQEPKFSGNVWYAKESKSSLDIRAVPSCQCMMPCSTIRCTTSLCVMSRALPTWLTVRPCLRQSGCCNCHVWSGRNQSRHRNRHSHDGLRAHSLYYRPGSNQCYWRGRVSGMRCDGHHLAHYQAQLPGHLR